jgi:anti-sigma B factor antagonist
LKAGWTRTLPLTITTRKAGNVTIVNMVGRLTLGPGATALREILLELSAGGGTGIVLNLSGVSNIDSSGIGELVSGFTTARSQGRAMKLAALPKRVEDLLRMTGIYRIFEIHKDEARAILSFE